MSVPVLLIIFNRPELTRRTLEAIACAGPRTLLVAADGPRSSEERDLCERTREVISDVDWGCEIRKDYSEKNLRCGVRVYTAIDWALSQYEEVIVLEDDCVPSPSFFGYCAELLEYYRDDERIMHISGNNFQPTQPTTRYSYYFSKYTHAWGWATWRRAWRHFDWSLRRWPEFKRAGLIQCWCDDPYEQRYWATIFDDMHKGARDVWDYQWNFACWAQFGLVILPCVNLVSNIGVGSSATHTKDLSPYLGLEASEIQSIEHPPYVFRNYEADAYTFANNFGGAAMKRPVSWRTKIRRTLQPLSLLYKNDKKLR